MKVINWLKTNKTTIAGLLTAVLVFLTAKGYIDLDTGLLITGLAAALGITLSKDSDKHSTSKQVKKADRKAQVLGEYPQLTKAERLEINTEMAGAGYVVHQIDAVIGYYIVMPDFRWEYAGTRPPRKPK